ncbi:MAG: hypothetical protein ACFFD2_14635 [Promethearchaeota archaeon]
MTYRTRRYPMYLEFGGPKVEKKFELVQVREMNEIEDGKVTIIGPDIRNLEKGKSYPIGILIEIAGREFEKEIEPIFECRIKEYTEDIEHVFYLNHRTNIWIRFSTYIIKIRLHMQPQLSWHAII